MPLNINDFRAAINKYDLERPNLFGVEITIPAILKKYKNGPEILRATENGKIVNLFCKDANLPGLNIVTAENQRYGLGPSIRMPVRGSLNDLSLTFFNDSNSYVYGFFYTWIQTIYAQTQSLNTVPGADLTYLHPFKVDYQTGASITVYHGKPGQFGGMGLLQTVASVASAAAGVPFIGSLLGGRSGPQIPLVPKKKYNIVKMYPTNISDISLSNRSSDTVSEFTVNFTYQTFEIQLLS